ncbi:hypothetical protein SLS63_002727 [Diaporthe eres]|uniref:Isomerase YbhE n=1 Tax=Diaporthe eres TaxID=83184 RepID=A0ABR1PIH4_DIAER
MVYNTLLMCLALAAAAAADSAGSAILYAASYSGDITSLSLENGNAGYTLNKVSVATGCGANPVWLEQDKKRKLLYCSDEAGTIGVFGVNSSSPGSLEPIMQMNSSYAPVASTMFDVNGTRGIAFAHYGSPDGGPPGAAGITTYVAGADGGLQLTFNLTTVSAATGPNAERQGASHIHQVVIDPTGKFMVAPDLGEVCVHVYRVQNSPSISSLTDIQLPPGSGPRHGVFQKFGKKTFFHVVSELANTVTSFKVSYDGNSSLSMTQTGQVSTFGDKPVPAGALAGEIIISPEGSITVSNRLDNSFTIPSLDPSNPTQEESDSLAVFKSDKQDCIKVFDQKPFETMGNPALSWAFLALLGTRFCTPVLSSIHTLYTSNFHNVSELYTLQFHDETLEFDVIDSTPADGPMVWLDFDHTRTILYGVSLETSNISSYNVLSNGSLSMAQVLDNSGSCPYGTGANAFVLASRQAPYSVYHGTWPGDGGACGVAHAVDESTGLLESPAAQSWDLTAASGVHGLAWGNATDGTQLLYVADLTGDMIWTNAVDRDTGGVTVLGNISVESGWAPRHVAVHPSSKYLFATMQTPSLLVSYRLDEDTGLVGEEVFRSSLIPEANSSTWWAADLAISASGRYLWESARSMSTEYPGYISAYLLADDGTIIEQMFQVPTSTNGAEGNVVAPAPWSDEYMAATYYGSHVVTVWKMEQPTTNSSDGLTRYQTASEVVKVGPASGNVTGGCCGALLWSD